jgi:hypothetical protein
MLKQLVKNHFCRTWVVKIVCLSLPSIVLT